MQDSQFPALMQLNSFPRVFILICGLSDPDLNTKSVLVTLRASQHGSL